MEFAGFEIDAERFYEEHELRLRGGVFSEATLRRARQAGELRYREPKRGHRLYKGCWLIEWLEREEKATA